MEQIADELNADGIPCKNGEVNWLYTAIGYILKSERYIGDALLQKSYTTDTFHIGFLQFFSGRTFGFHAVYMYKYELVENTFKMAIKKG